VVDQGVVDLAEGGQVEGGQERGQVGDLIERVGGRIDAGQHGVDGFAAIVEPDGLARDLAAVTEELVEGDAADLIGVVPALFAGVERGDGLVDLRALIGQRAGIELLAPGLEVRLRIGEL